MKKVEHIGIAVRDLSKSISLYEKLLHQRCEKTEWVENQQVTTAFFHSGDTKIELLQGSGGPDPITRFIEKKGEGIHHIAFEVEDLAFEMDRLRKEGFSFVSDEPTEGADHKMVCFIHPRHCAGVLVELCMEKKSPMP